MLRKSIISAVVMLSVIGLSQSGRSFQGDPPLWMDQWNSNGPEIRGDWIFGWEQLDQNKNYDKGFIPKFGSRRKNVGLSDGEGSALYVGNGYWQGYVPGLGLSDSQLGGFSLSNSIGAWLDARYNPLLTPLLRYSIREDYSDAGSVDNSSIVQIGADENEVLYKHAYNQPNEGVYDTLGVNDPYGAYDFNLSALDRVDGLDPQKMRWDFRNTLFLSETTGDWVGDEGSNLSPTICQDDETVYFTVGKTAEFNPDDSLKFGIRGQMVWKSADLESGEYSGPGHGIKMLTINDFGGSGDGGGHAWQFDNTGAFSGESYYGKHATFDGANWYLPVDIGGNVHYHRFDLAYDPDTYPNTDSSGTPIRWYDDYDLYLTGYIEDNPGAYGVTGRYITERAETIYLSHSSAKLHEADVGCDIRTYNPYYNHDGPDTPYEWLYDGNGDMYVPTNGSDLPGDTPEERAYKLIGCHPAFPDDDTFAETELTYDQDMNDGLLGGNYESGAVSQEVFEYAWKLASLMLDQKFWEDDPDYIWSNSLGAVAQRTLTQDNLVNIGHPCIYLPVYTWDGGEWVLPDSLIRSYADMWGWADEYYDTAVAGYNELNYFMRYVFDIDALTVEDVDGDGEFDIGEDYILFSLVDDGLFDKMSLWGRSEFSDDIYIRNTFFDGEYFDGDTVFLYDGVEVETFFDAMTDIFFGNPIDTTVPDFGDGRLWGWGEIFYDLDALDIAVDGIIPEPSTIFLMLGSASGLAVLAGIMRRKVH